MLRRSVELFKFKEWLRDYRGLSESSVYTYYTILKKFFIEVSDLDDVEAYNWFLATYTHKKRSTHYYSIIKTYIQFRFKNDIKTREEWLDKLLKPKHFKSIKIERRYLKEDKIIEIINNIKVKKHVVMSILQYMTAIRAGDALSIHRDGIVEDEYEGVHSMQFIVTGKGDKRNVVYLFDPIAQEIVRDYLKTYDATIKDLYNPYYEDYIFMTLGEMRNRPGDTDSFFMMQHANYVRYWNDLQQAIEASGVIDKKFFSTHDFRRCFARNVWEKYKDVDLLKRALNHENASTTLRYLRQSGLQNIDIFKQMQGTG